MTVWGTKGIADNSGYSESRGGHPFVGIESVREVERYRWPSPDDYDYAGLRGEFERAGSLARSLHLGWQPIFCRVLDLFGMQEAMVKMHTRPALIEATVAHVADFVLAAAERALRACGDLLDIYWYGDDFATQRGLMISPEHWRRFYAPAYRRIFELARSYGVKMWFHSCGSLVPVMPDLIDMGMQVWETCQVHLAGNDPATLKREFGRHIAFYGAINTQSTLPFGTVEDVRREVRERIAVLGRGGGYICGPDHTVMRGTPVENVLAWLDEAKANADPACVA
jgi:uroporphyrinogen decarboxylase